MAQTGLAIIDRSVKEEMGGTVDMEKDTWIIPISKTETNPLIK
jgi:hypothetical protein